MPKISSAESLTKRKGSETKALSHFKGFSIWDWDMDLGSSHHLSVVCGCMYRLHCGNQDEGHPQFIVLLQRIVRAMSTPCQSYRGKKVVEDIFSARLILQARAKSLAHNNLTQWGLHSAYYTMAKTELLYLKTWGQNEQQSTVKLLLYTVNN